MLNLNYYCLPLEIREMIALQNINTFKILQFVDKQLYQLIKSNCQYYQKYFCVKHSYIKDNMQIIYNKLPNGELHGTYTINGFFPFKNDKIINATLNYNNGYLDGIQKCICCLCFSCTQFIVLNGSKQKFWRSQMQCHQHCPHFEYIIFLGKTKYIPSFHGPRNVYTYQSSHDITSINLKTNREIDNFHKTSFSDVRCPQKTNVSLSSSANDIPKGSYPYAKSHIKTPKCSKYNNNFKKLLRSNKQQVKHPKKTKNFHIQQPK